MAFRNDIKKEYIDTRESLKTTFIESYSFLNWLESLSDKGFHVGTHKNLHLYFKDSFLFYLSKVSPTVMELSSKPNGKIKSKTVNRSDYFFSLLTQRLSELKQDVHKSFEVIKNGVYKVTITKSADSETLFDIITETINSIAQNEDLIAVINQVSHIANEFQIYNDAKDEKFLEGIQKLIITTYYERNQKARDKCLAHWKYSCVICGFNFEKTYGKLGEGYIHVHHLNPVSEIKEEYEIDPINDLRPVCPNCHAMLHRNKETLTIDQLTKLIEENKK